jgi:hypothetical protein
MKNSDRKIPTVSFMASSAELLASDYVAKHITPYLNERNRFIGDSLTGKLYIWTPEGIKIEPIR